MRNEVKALIGQLTAERSRIDVAISALKAMNGGETAAEPVKPKAAPGKRVRLNPADRAQAVSRLMRGDSPVDVANAFGIHVMTAYQIRRRAQASNGAHNEAAPQFTTTAAAVQ